MTFLPQEWELKKHTHEDSTILIGNLCAPAIDLQGIVIQNWLDVPFTVEKGELICSFEFGESEKIVLCGNGKTEGEMITMFKTYEVNKEQIVAQNFMRTVLSAIGCTSASKQNDFNTLEEKQLHITALLGKSNLGVNALKLNSTGEPKLQFKKNRRALNLVLLSQLLQKQIGLNNSDLIQIQDTCPFLKRMKEQALNLKTISSL